MFVFPATGGSCPSVLISIQFTLLYSYYDPRAGPSLTGLRSVSQGQLLSPVLSIGFYDGQDQSELPELFPLFFF